ncbi:complement regulator-acquiring protein [Borreliella americana]|uniref:complement regulator-acquiring protein n=1 Tax=Borreliella americana TaxID=478807 RepID=UPI001E3C9A3E|nr:complement regulator-acquiring protein [Borreliella americana]MCD2332430.1 complement regulator-acquiring protein [Borreliella americana]MCD2381902.1 complement regulator-acquiring protein [Borreliella americana]
MPKNKLNKIKLNIITIILTLFCISCAVNPPDSKVKSYTDLKEGSENFENESGELRSLNQKSPKEAIIIKLKALAKKLKDQKNEKLEIEKIIQSSLNCNTEKIKKLKKILKTPKEELKMLNLNKTI